MNRLLQNLLRFIGAFLVFVFLASHGSSASEPIPRYLRIGQKGLSSPDPGIRAQAARDLGGMGSSAQAAVPALMGALKDADTYVRVETAVALFRMGAAVAVVPTLMEALKHAERNLRWRAAGALGELGPAAEVAVPALIDALEDADENVRWGAAVALGQIGSVAKVAVPALTDALKDANANVRQGAAEALVKIQHQPAGGSPR